MNSVYNTNIDPKSCRKRPLLDYKNSIDVRSFILCNFMKIKNPVLIKIPVSMIHTGYEDINNVSGKSSESGKNLFSGDSPVEDKVSNTLSSVHTDNVVIAKLAERIKTHGLKMPIIVYKKACNDFCIIDGQKRLQAMTMLGVKKIPAIVIPVNTDDAKLFCAYNRCCNSLFESFQNPVASLFSVAELQRSYHVLHGDKPSEEYTQLNFLDIIDNNTETCGKLFENTKKKTDLKSESTIGNTARKYADNHISGNSDDNDSDSDHSLWLPNIHGFNASVHYDDVKTLTSNNIKYINALAPTKLIIELISISDRDFRDYCIDSACRLYSDFQNSFYHIINEKKKRLRNNDLVVIKNVNTIYNTLENALKRLSVSGLNYTVQKNENENEYVFSVVIKK